MDSSAFGPLCAEFLCKSWLVICRRVDGFFFFFFLRFDLRCGFCLFFFYREGASSLGLEILFVLRRLVSRHLEQERIGEILLGRRFGRWLWSMHLQPLYEWSFYSTAKLYRDRYNGLFGGIDRNLAARLFVPIFDWKFISNSDGSNIGKLEINDRFYHWLMMK